MIGDGGPAFPRPMSRDSLNPNFESVAYEQEGMSLRDWFAGQALAVVGDGKSDVTRDGAHAGAVVAAWCYELADAMLVVRAAAQEARP